MSTDPAQLDARLPDTRQGGLLAKVGSLRGPARLLAALVIALAGFGVLMLVKGVNPFTAYHDMFVSTFTDHQQLAGILVRATPIILAGLAVAVPARAGLINVGGEGQLLMGGVGAMGAALLINGHAPGPIVLVAMAVGGAVAGGLWSVLAALLRLQFGIAEAVTTLLLNYVALDILYFLIYDRWKDHKGSGQPATRPLRRSEHLPLWADTRVHLGLLIAVAAAFLVFIVFRKTSWGFRLQVVGGNAEAAKRAGLDVKGLIVSAMLVGGMLAGLGGFVQLAGAEFKLRSGFIAGYGYIGYLASWLSRHRPIGVVWACLLLSAIAISGDSLQLDSQLPAAGVNVLMALVLLGVFGFGKKRVAA
jgi:general nucleoside transport system permease protein